MLLCLLAGCSTHPCADFSDRFFPGRIRPNEVTPYGGVCIPQGPVVLPGPGVPIIGAPTPFGAPSLGGVIPPPLPLPGARPAGVQLQEPIPPLPPPPPAKFNP